jgi:hypothetical protein
MRGQHTCCAQVVPDSCTQWTPEAPRRDGAASAGADKSTRIAADAWLRERTVRRVRCEKPVTEEVAVL